MTTVQVQTQIPDRDALMKLVPSKDFRLVKFFENMAKDVSTTIPDAIGQSMQGPTGGVGDRDVVIFDGTSGTAVKDSGVLIDDLALLNSPHFTGTPTAPTPPALDNSTRLATTAYVDSGTANFVQGPAVSVNNDIALFNGTTGKVVKDSGVLLSSLATNAGVAATYAPLASPALTGNPTAPNQTLGDNDTSIANTAFVQSAISALSTPASSFSTHNNGTIQSIPNSAFTKLTFSTVVFNVGSNLTTSTWKPPAGRPVMLTGAVALTGAASAAVTLAVYKNGAEYKRGTMQLPFTSGPVVSNVSCIDIPNGTDTYELWAYQSTGSAQNTFGNANLTYFQGTTIQA